MNENPYEPPQHYVAPEAKKAKTSSAVFWFTVSVVAWSGFALFWSVVRALPHDRIWPDRLDANQSDLVHAAFGVAMLICISTGVVAGCAGFVAVIRR